jgi:hypothetical protein
MEDRMDNPKLIIDGKELIAKKPKAIFWRTIVKIEEELKSVDDRDYITKYAELIGIVFGLTTENVLNGLDIDEIRPKYIEICTWVIWLVNSKMEQIPKNAKSPENK